MDDKTKNIQPEIENLNLDEIDVEELEKRLELAVATALAVEPEDGKGCTGKTDCWLTVNKTKPVPDQVSDLIR
jgi:hypothetical protein